MKACDNSSDTKSQCLEDNRKIYGTEVEQHIASVLHHVFIRFIIDLL